MKIMIIVSGGVVVDVITAPGDDVVFIVNKDIGCVFIQAHDPVHPDGFDSYLKNVGSDDNGRPYPGIQKEEN